MKMTRCSGPEFHFFDGEKYKVCPVCGFPAAGKEEDSMPSVNDDAAAKKMHKEKEKKKREKKDRDYLISYIFIIYMTTGSPKYSQKHGQKKEGTASRHSLHLPTSVSPIHGFLRA